MYRVGQTVKIIRPGTNQHYVMPDNFVRDLLNTNGKIIEFMGGNEEYLLISTSLGVMILNQNQVRPLKPKKKTAVSAVALEAKKPTLGDEVNWLNKIQKNFQNLGEYRSGPSRESRASGWASTSLLRDVFNLDRDSQPQTDTEARVSINLGQSISARPQRG